MNRRSIYQASATLLPLVLAVKSIVAQCPYYRLTPWMVGFLSIPGTNNHPALAYQAQKRAAYTGLTPT